MISKQTLFFCLFILLTQVCEAQGLIVRNINIEGNKRTKDFVIKRELFLDVGDTLPADLSASLIARVAERLMNTNLFNKVEITDSIETGYIDIDINVIEKWYDWPIPFFEFSDRNFNVWQNFKFSGERVNYGFYIFDYNLFGRNHTLKTSIVAGYNQKLGLEYRVPFLSTKSSWGLEAKTLYSNQHEVWIETKEDKLQFYNSGSENLINNFDAVLNFTNRVMPNSFVNAGLDYGLIKVRQEVIDQNKNYLFNTDTFQNKYIVFAGFRYDTRDNVYLPLKGNLLKIDVGYEHYRNTGSMNNYTGQFYLQNFQQLKDKIYSVFAFYFDGNTSSNLPYNSIRMFGYDHNIRGFENNVVEGQVGMIWNFGLKYHLIDRTIPLNFIPVKSYSFLPINVFIEYFSDIGKTYLAQSPSSLTMPGNELPNSSMYSSGLGIQMLFYNDRVVRFEYSYNNLKQKGLYIHFKKAI